MVEAAEAKHLRRADYERKSKECADNHIDPRSLCCYVDRFTELCSPGSLGILKSFTASEGVKIWDLDVHHAIKTLEVTKTL